jgi:hypothetical protein
MCQTLVHHAVSQPIGCKTILNANQPVVFTHHPYFCGFSITPNHHLCNTKCCMMPQLIMFQPAAAAGAAAAAAAALQQVLSLPSHQTKPQAVRLQAMFLAAASISAGSFSTVARAGKGCCREGFALSAASSAAATPAVMTGCDGVVALWQAALSLRVTWQPRYLVATRVAHHWQHDGQPRALISPRSNESLRGIWLQHLPHQVCDIAHLQAQKARHLQLRFDLQSIDASHDAAASKAHHNSSSRQSSRSVIRSVQCRAQMHVTLAGH